jgi:hypothetical protein
MKTAKEMFEELGYDYVGIDEFGCFLTYYKKTYDIEIYFDLEDGTFQKVMRWNGLHPSIKYKELQAINKQVEELGWNDV